MKVLDKIRSTPIWFVLPSIAVAGAIGLTVAGYTPLIFDPSLYQTESALASELKALDADALEGSGASANVGGGAADLGDIKDGTWTGYAVCGEGNDEDWKPYYVSVTIDVKDRKVTAIRDIVGASTAGEGAAALNWDPAENQKYLDQAIEGHGGNGVRAQMESQISAQGAVTGVDTVSGATYSSVAIYNAYVDAVQRGGGTVGGSGVSAGTTDSDGSSKSISGSSTKKTLADGTWTGYAACGKGNSDNWKPYYVGVSVKVKNGKVKGITKVWGSSKGNAGDAALSWDASENQKYLTWATSGHNGDAGVKNQINAQAAKGSVASIDTVSKATYSSEAIFEAYSDALAKSAQAAGSSVKKKGKVTKKKTTTPETVERDTNVGALADGQWTAYATCGPDPDQDWKPYYVKMTITVKNGKLASIDAMEGTSEGESGDPALTWDAAENAEYLDGAISVVGAKLKESAAAGTIPSSIDTVSGATYSSEALFDALFAALKKSAAAGGATIEVPDPSASEDDDASGDSSSSAGKSDQDGDSGGNTSDDEDSDADSGGNTSDDEDSDADGTFYGYALCESSGDNSWSPYYLFVSVKAADGVVTAIDKVYGDKEGIVDSSVTYNASENDIYLNWAIDGKFGGTGYRMKSVVKQIQAKLDAGSAVSGIQTVSGATRSSKSILAAYEMAAANAAAGTGATPEDAVAGN